MSRTTDAGAQALRSVHVITWATSDRSNSTFSWFTWDLAGFYLMLPASPNSRLRDILIWNRLS